MPKIGTVTGSRIKDLMTGGRGKAKWGKTSKGLALRIAAEQLGIMDLQLNQYSSASMDWGNEHEAEAIEAYEQAQFVKVHSQQKFMQHPEYDHIGATPDGLVGENGVVEVKCPYNSLNHLQNVLSGAQTKQYMPQSQLELWCTGRDWVDFVSYDPRIEGDHSLYVQRIQPDAEFIAEMAERYQEFCEIVAEYKAELAPATHKKALSA